MADNNFQQPTGNVLHKFRSLIGTRLFKVVFLGVVFLAAVITVIVLILKAVDTGQTTDNQPVSNSIINQYLISKLDGSKQTISLERPNWFNFVKSDSSPVKNEYISQNNATKDMGGKSAIVIYGIYSKVSNAGINPQSIKGGLDKRDGDYKALADTLGINEFITSEINHGYNSNGDSSGVNLTLERPTAFSNTNTKSDAWEFDYLAEISHSSQITQTIKGKLVFVLGQTTDHTYNTLSYVLLSSTDSVWQKNTGTWQTIINGISVTEKK